MKLYDACKVIRSKNSGPFEITLDLLFSDKKIYEKIKKENIITKDLISNIYKINTNMINDIVYFDAANGLKITYARPISSGSCFDRDVYGAQQHAPLMDIEI